MNLASRGNINTSHFSDFLPASTSTTSPLYPPSPPIDQLYLQIMDKINDGENLARMQRGELYYAFTPALIAQRERCKNALNRFNQATIGGATRATRRKRILTRDSIAQDQTPLPLPAATEAEDEILLQDEPYVEGPIKIDYGYNVMYVSKYLRLG